MTGRLQYGEYKVSEYFTQAGFIRVMYSINSFNINKLWFWNKFCRRYLRKCEIMSGSQTG